MRRLGYNIKIDFIKQDDGIVWIVLTGGQGVVADLANTLIKTSGSI
jgi:hypothetical protein